MLTSIQGIYRDGRIELSEKPSAIENNTPVIVTFLTQNSPFPTQNSPFLTQNNAPLTPSRMPPAPNSMPISLAKRGITEQQAQAVRSALSTFAEEWDSAEMDVYNNYHKDAK